jgi:uncharacterized membrane protein
MPQIEVQGFEQRRAVRQALCAWRERGSIGASPAMQAWRATEPGAARWAAWLDRALLTLGAALLCAGVIVFFAFNWQALHKFTRFGVLAALLSGLAAFAALRPAGDALGRTALFGASVCTGVLLAVIGQVYQTGADAWQLFALWAALSIPWALAARAAPHWWLTIVLANVALLRWFSIRPGVSGMFDLMFGTADKASLLLLTACALAQLALWFALCRWAARFGFRGRAGARIVAALVCVYAGCLGLGAVAGRDFSVALFLASLLLLALLAWWFRARVFDVLVLSLAAFAGIALTVAAIGRLVFEGNAETSGFLLLGVLTIGLSAAAATWLTRAYRRSVAEAS